jgi:hypothetical protein
MSIDMQLINVFNNTLAALPNLERSKIEGFWKSQGVQEHNGRLVPAVRKLQDLGKGSVCANTDGVVFSFKSAFVDQAPEEILKICIAHELAHARRAAEFDMPPNDATAYGYTSHEKEEDTANTLMKAWGFDHAKLITWLQENVGRIGL